MVLRVSANVLDLPGVMITDGNGASAATRAWALSEGLTHIDLDRIYARTWYVDGERNLEGMRVMQAEVLVPQRVLPRFIEGCLVPSDSCRERAMRAVPRWSYEVSRALFFAT